MTDALSKKLPDNFFRLVMIGLTLASFPGACFSSFIAANSFKTVMPKVNPLVSVGIGTIVSIALAVTGIAGDLPSVFGIIGASFGPICGAMTADYLLNGRRWSGPARASIRPAGSPGLSASSSASCRTCTRGSTPFPTCPPPRSSPTSSGSSSTPSASISASRPPCSTCRSGSTPDEPHR